MTHSAMSDLFRHPEFIRTSVLSNVMDFLQIVEGSLIFR
ncbi:hypothetical protein D1BOALGB6SA_9853 [Olavius sp. associated proteobacterium Delta 1]|nr:hypothetical protein D1BOALGB6SA_9853 [Olavius sp. associated proteobacterium Delta 1]